MRALRLRHARGGGRVKRLAFGGLALAVTAASALVATATPVAAAEGDVSSGTLTWAVHTSWNSYIRNPMWGSDATISPVEPSTTKYVFPVSSGSVTSETAGSVQSDGGVHWILPEHFIDLQFDDIKVSVTGTHADIFADVTANYGVEMAGQPAGLRESANVKIATSDSANISVSGTEATITIPGNSIYGTADAVAASFPYGDDENATNNDAWGANLTVTVTTEAAPPPASTATITLSKSTGLNLDGDSIQVTGAGGSGLWWVVSQETYDYAASVYGPSGTDPNANTFSQFVLLQPDGSFQLDLTVAAAQGSITESTPGTYGVYTYGASGATGAAFETFTPITFAAAQPGGTENSGNGNSGNENSGSNQCTADSAQLSWGVKASFAAYVEGSGASGAITTSGGAARSGSTFTWGTGSGTLTDSGLGTVSFPGSVHFTGHNGILDLTIANPQVTVTSSTSGTLVATVTSQDEDGEPLPGGTVTIATLAFGSVTKSGGTAQVTLTSEGAASFAGFYEAGTVVDPLTVSFCGDDTVGSGAGAAPVVSIPGDGTVKAGGSVTFNASGFAPGESVTGTVYSTPVPLGSKTADSKGRVSFTWTVPTDFEAGAHRVELVGASGTKAELRFTVTAPAAENPTTAGTATTSVIAAQPVCTPETVPGKPGSAQLSWGVKSSFVSYIEGGIAKGTITASNGAARSGSGFTWGSGTGTLNSSGVGTVAFPGSLRLTGHGGVLDLTISHLQVKNTGGNSGELVATVKSQDMEGNAIPGGTVTIATLTFGSLSGSGGTASVTLTSAGAAAFAGFYEAGTAVDPLVLTVSQGSAPTTQQVCRDAAGNIVDADGTPLAGGSAGVANLAFTGVAGIPALLGVFALLTLLGLALVVAARRRTETVQHS